MAKGKMIERIASIEEQMQDLKKMVLESGSGVKEDEVKLETRAWVTEVKKLEKKWPKTVPPVLEMIKWDRINNE